MEKARWHLSPASQRKGVTWPEKKSNANGRTSEVSHLLPDGGISYLIVPGQVNQQTLLNEEPVPSGHPVGHWRVLLHDPVI